MQVHRSASPPSHAATTTAATATPPLTLLQKRVLKDAGKKAGAVWGGKGPWGLYLTRLAVVVVVVVKARRHVFTG